MIHFDMKYLVSCVAFTSLLCGLTGAASMEAAQRKTSLTTTPSPVVLIAGPESGGSTAFQVSGLNLQAVTAGRVAHGTRVLASYRVNTNYDERAKVLHVQIDADSAPLSGAHTVQLLAGRSIAHEIPFTVRRPFRSITEPGTSRLPPDEPRFRIDPQLTLGPLRPVFDADAVTRRGGGAPSMSAYAPQNEGPAGGTVVILGENLPTSIKLFFGNDQLPLILVRDTRAVFQLPRVTTSTTRPLTLELSSSRRASRIVVAQSYRVATARDLPPRAELVELNQSIGNLPHAKNRYSIRVYNVPATHVSGNLVSLDGEIKDIAFGGDVQLDGELLRVFGSSFSVSFAAKPDRAVSQLRLIFRGSSFTRPGSGVRVIAPLLNVNVALPTPVAKQDYIVQNTADLEPFLQWRLYSSWGTTSGQSWTPFREIPVGRMNIQGDTSFRIASGPVGTEAVWGSAPLLLNEGWYVKSIRWSIVRNSPSGQAAKANVVTPATNDMFRRVPDQFMNANTASVWPQPTGQDAPPDAVGALMMRFAEQLQPDLFGPTFVDAGKDSFVWYMRPIRVRLKADVTLLNDHDVTVRLDSVTFNGPRGRRWQDAIQSAVPNSEDGVSFLIASGTAGDVDTLRLFQARMSDNQP